MRNNPISAFETLKNEKEKRFDNWFYKASQVNDYGIDLPATIGKQILIGPEGYSLLKADWSSFDVAAAIPDLAFIKGKTLQARVDVGYEREELAADYQVEMRYNVDVFRPFVLHEDLGETKATEVARLIIGYDSMSVNLEPGKDVFVVMRTFPQRNVAVRDATVTYTFANPLELNIAVDGELATRASVEFAEKGFSDVGFSIPGAAIKSGRSRISFLGDHIACCYWFFQ